MNENQFKKKLFEEINFYRTHTLEEIDNFNNDVLFNENKKNTYDSIPENEIESYVNNCWLKYLYTLEISAKTYDGEDGFDTRLLVQKVENFGLEDYKFKQKFQQEMKEAIKNYGTLFLTLETISAFTTFILQTLEIFNESTIFLGGTLVSLIGIAMLKKGVIPLMSKKKAVEILKEKGIYNKLVGKMSIEKELEEIENEGKVR